MANEKYALLDTDFISKMHLIRKDDHNKLIDKIMAMPGYCFYCHLLRDRPHGKASEGHAGSYPKLFPGGLYRPGAG